MYDQFTGSGFGFECCFGVQIRICYCNRLNDNNHTHESMYMYANPKMARVARISGAKCSPNKSKVKEEKENENTHNLTYREVTNSTSKNS